MRTVAIILGDNDFGSTFKNLLETIYNVLIWRFPAVGQTEVKYLIEEGLRFHYLAFQLHVGEQTEEEIAETLAYLSSEMVVLFDDEAEQDIEHNDHDSGAWYLIVQSGEVRYY